MKILVGGDYLVPSEREGHVVEIDPALNTLMSSHDFRIVNLEGPISDEGSPIIKTGPSIRAARSAIDLAKKLKIDLFALANNHIMDYGECALFNTLSICKQNRIDTVGAGATRSAALAPFVLSRDSSSIAIINFAENEWASASDEHAGAAPYDLVLCANEIRAAAKTHDHVLVIVHGGSEYFPLPSPRMVKESRFFVDCGASAVVTHHAHTISGYEIYKQAPIFYGLGNFLFCTQSALGSWYKGLLVSLNFHSERSVSFKVHFIGFTRDFGFLRLLSSAESSAAAAEIASLNRTIADRDALRKAWADFVASRADDYLLCLHPLNFRGGRLLLRIFRKLGLLSVVPDKTVAAQLLNRMRCESHLDVFRAVLRDVVK